MSLSTNFPGADTQYTGNVAMIQSVTLYNGSSWSTSPAWSFQYNDRDPGDPQSINYGDLTQITFPTGGTLSYTWTSVDGFNQPSRSVTSRTVNANDGTGPHTWNYTPVVEVGGTNVVTDPLGNDSVYTVTYLGSGQSGYVTQAQYYQGSHNSGTLLKTETTDYTYTSLADLHCSPWAGVFNVLAIRVTTTWPNGQVSKVETDYDASSFTFKNLNVADTHTYGGSFGQVLAKRYYDYGSGAPGALLSQAVNTYVASSGSAYQTYNMLDLLSSVTVKDGSGNQKAYTFFGYDEYGSYPLQSSGITMQHDASPPNGNTRGNQTSVHRWVNTSGTYLVSSSQFYDTGTVNVSKDPMQNPTTFNYSGSFYGAYPTTITNALNQTTKKNYDFNTGLLATVTDANNQTTSYSYDSLFRTTQVNFPDGGQATFSYQDLPLPAAVTISKLITASTSLTAKAMVDGVGRKSQTQLTSDPDGTVYVDTTYDALGRKYCVSNPYRTTGDSTFGITTYQYDVLNRVKQVQPPDYWANTPASSPTCQSVTPSTQPANPSNNVTTNYSGNTTTVTDEAGKKRESATDGLGRLTQVWEDPSGLNYETDYQYDALNNLTIVVQNGSRQRSFAYNSLSQLTSSTNPESNTAPSSGTTVATTYTYDNDGNLSQKTMPAQNQQSTATVTLTYCYDALNRMTAKGYTAQTCTNGSMPSPVATYLYDQASYNGLTITNGIGRRTGMSDAAGAEAWSYDVMGRVLTDQRTMNSVTKSTTYTYFPYVDGSLYQLTYPSGRTITYVTGGAERVLSAIDQNNSINYATAGHYAPQGAVASLANGASLHLTSIYNSRLQPCWLYTTTGTALPWGSSTQCTLSATTGNILDMKYNFNLGAGNNGNVVGITNNGDTTRSQTFAYDSLNRILVGETTSTYSTSPANCWGESYVYDNQSGGGAWGNLTNINVASTAYNGCTQESLSVTVNAQNRISTSGYKYDTAGNLTNTPNPGGVSAQYNAENQLTTGNTVTYLYDGDGKRVQKSSGTLYWYGMNSDALDETDLSGNITSEYIFFGGKRIARRDASSNIFYYFGDHLGTSRVITNATGAICYNADFYPFGGERVITNTCPQNYKFTGKERDGTPATETGLDNFGARYFGSSAGRFTSPDPKNSFAKQLGNPQDMNLYIYTINNPLRYGDPDGKDWATAWKDVKTFFSSLSVKLTVGAGLGEKWKVGRGEAKVEVKGSYGLEVGGEDKSLGHKAVQTSKSVELGATAGIVGGPKLGEGTSVNQVTSTLYSNGSATGQEKPTVEKTDTIGGESTVVKSSDDKVGVGGEVGALLLIGVEGNTSGMGLSALADAFRQARDALYTPPPPPPAPPPPPTPLAPEKP